MPSSKSKAKRTKATTELSNKPVSSSSCRSSKCCIGSSNDAACLIEKLQLFYESKLKPIIHTSQQSILIPSKSGSKQLCRKLPYGNVLSQLFLSDNNTLNRIQEEIYSKPIMKSLVLEKFESFIHQTSETCKNTNDTLYCFSKTNLQTQMQYRMIPLTNDLFGEQMKAMKTRAKLTISCLRINHVHSNGYLRLKIISVPKWSYYAVHVIVEDENSDCIRLSIYNWWYTVNTRQLKSYNYVQELLLHVLPLNSSIVLLDPWLKMCRDGEVGLRCESPNTHLMLTDFEARCSTSSSMNEDQLRQWGNTCYQNDDNLFAIQLYGYGFKQIKEKKEKCLSSSKISTDTQAIVEEYTQQQVRLLSNRCACYLRERHSTLALADTMALVLSNKISKECDSLQVLAGKIVFRCLSAQLHMGLFDKVDTYINSIKLSGGVIHAEVLTATNMLSQESIRLREECVKGRYDLREMLSEQVSVHNNEKAPLLFADLPHHHAECHRSDLFEVRPCRPEDICKSGYPKGSYGIYALKDIEPGTLLVVEQPFASIDNRIVGAQHCSSLNFWQSSEKNSAVEYVNDNTLRLLNEVEKQLMIGSATSTAFDSIKLMQPIRRWLAEEKWHHEIVQERKDDTFKLLGDDQISTPPSERWQKSFLTRQTSPSSCFPWRILFETQQQNPFHSKSTLGWYPLGFMFNHSCLPNCLWYLIGDYLFIYVCGSNVRQGDELTISYCPLWTSSLNERASHLRSFGITCCRCSLCTYDRSNMPQYEIELKKFFNLRALSRQKNLASARRFNYVKELNLTYEFIAKKFRQRPAGFMNELIDLEYVVHYLQQSYEQTPSNKNDSTIDDEIRKFLSQHTVSFLTRLARVSRLKISDLPKVNNPVLLFGTQIRLLIHHMQHNGTRLQTDDFQKWNHLLEHLYEIFTFKCHVSTENMQKALDEPDQFFVDLLQTQAIF